MVSRKRLSILTHTVRCLNILAADSSIWGQIYILLFQIKATLQYNLLEKQMFLSSKIKLHVSLLGCHWASGIKYVKWILYNLYSFHLCVCVCVCVCVYMCVRVYVSVCVRVFFFAVRDKISFTLIYQLSINNH